MTRSEKLLRSLLSLEGLSGAGFVRAVCELVGAEQLLLYAPVSGGGQRLALSTPLDPVVEPRLQTLPLAAEQVARLFPACGSLSLLRDDAADFPFDELFPNMRWALLGVGDSWSSCAIFLGAGAAPGTWTGDALVCSVLMRRLSEQAGADWCAARTASEALARLSHEFKTPLVSIKGYAELILDQSDSTMEPRLRDWVRRIAGGANRLASLYRKATAQARSEEEDSYEARPVDPVEWVRRCVDEVATLASQRDLDWSCSPVGELPYVGVDPEAAHEMLVELLQNAARATPDGGRVEVRLAVESRKQVDGVRVTVSDSGVGIPRGAAGTQLFERFATVGGLLGHHSGDFEYGAAGLGLGLSMARGVALAHGGELWLEARGRDAQRLPGATFHVWLPLHTEQAEKAEGAVEGEARGRILLLDPDPEVRHILEAALANDYQLVGVGTAAEAARRWAEEDWQACILEPCVPRGGVPLIQALKAQPGRETAVLLTYSTGVGHSEAAAWRAAGADSCVGKPARTRVLLQRLRTVRARKTRR